MSESHAGTPESGRWNALLRAAAQRLGTTPEALTAAAEQGDLSGVLGSAGPEQARAMQQALSDPETAKQLLSSPQARKLFRMLGQEPK